jgi:hypothetical protein
MLPIHVRGFWTIFIEWYISFAKLVGKFPYIGITVGVFATVLVEENFSEHPIFSNTIRYFMYKSDPEAADMIFAERKVEADPIGKAAAIAVEEAAKKAVDSAEWRMVKEDLEADALLQMKRSAYVLAGLKDQVAAVDEELAARREDRAAKRAEKKERELEAASTRQEPVVEPEPAHVQGEPISLPEKSQAEPAEGASPEAEPAQPTQEGRAGKRREGKAGKAGRAAEDALDAVQRLAPP